LRLTGGFRGRAI